VRGHEALATSTAICTWGCVRVRSGCVLNAHCRKYMGGDRASGHRTWPPLSRPNKGTTRLMRWRMLIDTCSSGPGEQAAAVAPSLHASQREAKRATQKEERGRRRRTLKS